MAKATPSLKAVAQKLVMTMHAAEIDHVRAVIEVNGTPYAFRIEKFDPAQMSGMDNRPNWVDIKTA